MKISNRMIRTVLLVGILTGFVCGQPSYTGLEGWYDARMVATAGAGGLQNDISGARIHPASLVGQPRQFQLAVVRYPAGITAESLCLVFPRENRTYALEIDHLGYGEFDAIDETGTQTGTYRSGDTWAQLGMAGRVGTTSLHWGLRTGLFYSQLASYESIAWTLSPGLVLDIEVLAATVGVSIQNIGSVLKTYDETTEPLPTTLIVGIGKDLAHLPLRLTIDAGHRLADGSQWLRLGGLFTLSPALAIMIGSSTDKFPQQTQTAVWSDFLAATGAGLRFGTRNLKVDAGTYFYGPGGWISSVGVNVVY